MQLTPAALTLIPSVLSAIVALAAIIMTQVSTGRALRHQVEIERVRHIRDQRTRVYSEQFERMSRIRESLSVVALDGLDGPANPPLLPDLEEYLDAELKVGSPLRLFCSEELWVVISRYQSAMIELMVSVPTLKGKPLSAEGIDEELRHKIEGILDFSEQALRIALTQMRFDLGISTPSPGWQKIMRTQIDSSEPVSM
jgi:hypothetical protein